MSLDSSQVPWSIFMYASKKKNILENGDVMANLFYLGGLMSQYFARMHRIMLFRVSES